MPETVKKRVPLSIDQSIEQSRKIKNLEANNSRLTDALKACLLVLSGERMAKDQLVAALTKGQEALIAHGKRNTPRVSNPWGVSCKS